MDVVTLALAKKYTNSIALGQGAVQGPPGPAGSQGSQGPAGPQGLQGIQGPVGPTGAQGPQGLQGEQGLQGIPGETGPQGTTGQQGPSGTTGATGPMGLAGPAGAQGEQGPQGIQGIQGPQGEPGAAGAVGPTGAQGPQGIQGEQGPEGEAAVANINYKGIWSAGTFVKNDCTISPVDGNSYVCITTTTTEQPGPAATGWSLWVQKGPIGLTGAQGPQGVQGEPGPQGIQGEQGIQGVQGEQGQQGEQGEPGAQGADGAQGNNGPAGPQGIQGIQGEQGLQGQQGPQGIQGEQGAQGPQGISNPYAEDSAKLGGIAANRYMLIPVLPEKPVTPPLTGFTKIKDIIQNKPNGDYNLQALSTYTDMPANVGNAAHTAVLTIFSQFYAVLIENDTDPENRWEAIINQTNLSLTYLKRKLGAGWEWSKSYEILAADIYDVGECRFGWNDSLCMYALNIYGMRIKPTAKFFNRVLDPVTNKYGYFIKQSAGILVEFKDENWDLQTPNAISNGWFVAAFGNANRGFLPIPLSCSMGYNGTLGSLVGKKVISFQPRSDSPTQFGGKAAFDWGKLLGWDAYPTPQDAEAANDSCNVYINAMAAL